MIKRMVKFLISSNRKSFNVYVFFFTWLALSLYEVLVLKYISINDSGYNPKYVILCNIGLFIYALICGNIVKHKKYYYLPSLLLPISFSI